MRRSGRNLLICLSSFLALSIPPAGGSPPPPPEPEGSPGALRPGDRLEIDGVGLIVPDPGTGVWGAALRVDGGHEVLGIETRPDGSVVVHRGSAASGGSDGPAERARGACTDGAYSLDGEKWKTSYRWYFNRSSTPSEVNRDNATEAVRDGVKNITRADNDCGLGDTISATQDYKGTIDKGVNIGSNSTCKSSDGKSVIGFGNLLAGDLAFTCWWTKNGDPVEGDIRFNKTEYLWVVNVGNVCLTKFSVEAVATHEAGHVFGLGHVSEGAHGSLTMSTVMLACQSSEKTLGLGDIEGLEDLY
jgi:hypothetical protein